MNNRVNKQKILALNLEKFKIIFLCVEKTVSNDLKLIVLST